MSDYQFQLSDAIQNWLNENLQNWLNENLQNDNALVQFANLKNIESALKACLDEIKPQAIEFAKKQLALAQRTSGDFAYKDHKFSLSKKNIYDMAGKPQRYTMPEGVQYRDLANQKADLAKRSSAITRFMDALVKTFAAQHPDFKPDDTQFVLKVME